MHHSLMLVVRVIVRGGVESEGRGVQSGSGGRGGYLSFNSIVTYIYQLMNDLRVNNFQD